MAEGYRVERLRLRRTRQIDEFHDMVSCTFEPFTGYTPISREAFHDIVVTYLRFAGTRLARVLRAPDGTGAGFSIAFPDPSEAFARAPWA